jgi:hypothetical protein
MALLKQFNAQDRNASDTPGKSYAPALFASEPDCRFSSRQFEAAMKRLFKAGDIHKVNHGYKSNP